LTRQCFYHHYRIADAVFDIVKANRIVVAPEHPDRIPFVIAMSRVGPEVTPLAAVVVDVGVNSLLIFS